MRLVKTGIDSFHVTGPILAEGLLMCVGDLNSLILFVKHMASQSLPFAQSMDPIHSVYINDSVLEGIKLGKHIIDVKLINEKIENADGEEHVDRLCDNVTKCFIVA
jgi:hypothetical protein